MISLSPPTICNSAFTATAQFHQAINASCLPGFNADLLNAGI
jgi:hypothetical protein